MPNTLTLFNSGNSCATTDADGLEAFKVRYQFDETTNAVTVGVSSDITFKKSDCYDFLKDFFWDCSDGNRGCDKNLGGVINLCKCDKNVDVEIVADDTEYCPFSCEIKAPLTVRQKGRSLDCLKQPYWTSFYFPLNLGGILGQSTNNFTKGFQPLLFPRDNATDIQGILVREALICALEACGITFCSDLLLNPNSLYHNLAIIHHNIGNAFYTLNTPDMNICELLDCLKGLLNADYTIEPIATPPPVLGVIDLNIKTHKLTFERKDYFDNNLTQIKLSDFEFEANPCFQYVKGQNCANAFLKYEDPSSTALNFDDDDFDQYLALYSNRVEWNPNNLDNREGTCEKFFCFSPPIINETTGELTSYGYPDSPTVVIWDGTSPRNAAQIIHDPTCGYNYPLYVTEDPNCPTLYSELHSIDNPDNGNDCLIELTDNIELTPKDFCAFQELIEQVGLNFEIDTEVCGSFKPKEIEIDYEKCTVTFGELEEN